MKEIKLIENCTIGEFIDNTLKENLNDWGFIAISNIIEYYSDYSDGKLLDDKPTLEISSRVIQNVVCYSSSNNKDYIITIKE